MRLVFKTETDRRKSFFCGCVAFQLLLMSLLGDCKLDLPVIKDKNNHTVFIYNYVDSFTLKTYELCKELKTYELRRVSRNLSRGGGALLIFFSRVAKKSIPISLT